MWTLPSRPLRRPVDAAHVLREDPPRLDAAGDVDAHVAVERRAHVVGPHRGRDADRRGLVPAARVEAAGDLPLAVEDVAALLDPAREEHVAVDAEQVLAVEARLRTSFSEPTGSASRAIAMRRCTLPIYERSNHAARIAFSRTARLGEGLDDGRSRLSTRPTGRRG